MTPRGPAKTGDPLNIRIPSDQLDAIDQMADDSDTSRSDVVRTLIGEALMYRARKAARRAK